MKARLAVIFSALLLAVIVAAATLVSCNRDPNVLKKKYLEMGDTYFKREQYKQAALLYRNALQRDQKYAMAYYKLALTQLKLQNPSAALYALRRALENLPPGSAERTDANVKLSDLYLAMGARDKQLMADVETVAKDLLKKDPNSFDGHRLLASVAFVNARMAYSTMQADVGKADLQTSVEEFRKADAAKPGQTQIRLALADVLMAPAIKGYAEAEKICREVIKQEKNAPQPYLQLYQLLIIQNRLNDAEEVLKLASQNNPKDMSYLTLLARHYYGAKRRDDMVKVLDQIKSHAKEFPNAYLTVGDFYYRLGDGDEAIRQYNDGIQNDAKNKPTYQKHMIEVLMHQGQRARAAEINEQILKANPKDNDARGLQATLLLDKGDIQKALNELQSVITSAPDNFVAHHNLGRAHLARGEYEQARQQFSEAIRLRPDYLPSRLELAKLQATRGDYEAALKSTNEVLQWDRGNLGARLIQSAALMGMKKYDESRQLLQALLKVDPNSGDALFQLGVVNLAQNKYTDAIDAFRKDYSIEPSNPRGLMGAVEVYLAENKEDQAVETLQNEIQKNPNRTDYHVALGNTAVRVGKYDVAIAEFQKVLEKMDNNSKSAGELYLRIGETCRRKGDFNGAVTNLQKARQLLPDNTLAVATLGLTLDSAGRKQEAKMAYEQCLKLDPRHGVALNNLAYLLAENNGDLDQALTYAQRAKQLLPNLYEVSDTLGWIYLKKQLTDNAIEAFKDIVSKQPTHSTYRYHLGMAYAQKGDRPKAIEELNKSLHSNPPKEEQDKIRQLLQKLGAQAQG
jgi:tetratricopeptide (TPR) repeat protein